MSRKNKKSKKPKIRELPKSSRPREKLMEKGPEALKDYELLAILFGWGLEGQNVLELSKKLLSKYPANKFVNLSFDKLKKLRGIGSVRACIIKAALELSKRALSVDDSMLPLINNPNDVINQISEIKNNKKENFMALYLNARNQLIHKEKISMGSLNASIVHPREIFQPAIANSAASIIIIHNHPSGDPTPTEEDIIITKQIKKAGDILGIDVLDHIIIGKSKFISMKEKGIIKF